MIEPDTIVCGHGMTFNGKRYLVTEVLTSPNGPFGFIQIQLKATPYEQLDPVLYAFDPPKPKPAKRKRKKPSKPKRKKTK